MVLLCVTCCFPQNVFEFNTLKEKAPLHIDVISHNYSSITHLIVDDVVNHIAKYLLLLIRLLKLLSVVGLFVFCNQKLFTKGCRRKRLPF